MTKQLSLSFFLITFLNLFSTPTFADTSSQCEKTISQAGWALLSWTTGKLEDNKSNEIFKALCQASCYGFCQSDSPSNLSAEQKKLQEQCNKTGYAKDCEPFMASIGVTPKSARGVCFYAGGAACYNSPYSLHDTETLLYAALACKTGVSGACWAIKNLSAFNKNAPPSNEKFTPACVALNQNEFGDQIAEQFKSACDTKTTFDAKANPPGEKFKFPYPCSDWQIKGEPCTSNWQPSFGCACVPADNKMPPYYTFECENGKKGVKCPKNSPAVLLPVKESDLPTVEKTPSDVRIDSKYVFKKYNEAACDPYKKKYANKGYPYADCLKALAVTFKNSKACLKLTEENYRNECLTFVAIALYDPKACLKLTPPSQRTIYDDLMTEEGSPLNCLTRIYSVAPSLAICQFYKKFVQGNSKLADTCFAQIAQREKNTTLCEQIEQTGTYNRCLAGLAFETKDISLCDKLVSPSPSDKISCAILKSAVTAKDLCQELKKENQDECYQRAAGVAKKPEFCGKISSTDQQIRCYNMMVFDSKDVTICHQITERKVREECYSQYSGQSHEPENCRLIPADFAVQRANCFLNGHHCDLIDPNAKDPKAFNRNIKDFCLKLH